MAEFTDRESFIPFRRSDVVALCIEDRGWKGADAEAFRSFSEILSAFYHFRFQKTLENLKDHFAPLDPDADTISRKPLSALQQADQEEELVKELTTILRSANYKALTEAELKEAFQSDSLIPLNTDVDFGDFEKGRMIFYHRGMSKETVTKREFLRKKDFTFDVFDRVVLLLKFKGEEHFNRKKKKQAEKNFTPGKMYVYLYKKIPKYDLDILFPNVEISMTWKDLIRFGVPAISAFVPIVLKALPNLLLIVGVILYFTMGESVAERWGITDQAMKNTLPIVTAILSLAFVLGSYATKQYLNYKNKRLKFLKNVTDTLFFKSLDCNAGVFHRLVDEAEEEECKEILLVYYFLLKHDALTREQLDDRIEAWMEEKFGAKIDFNVDKALDRLRSIRGVINGRENSLLAMDNGICHALPLDDAKILIDYAWDNVFTYNR